jgi:hypothetical protein
MVVILIGSTVLIRKGSMMVFMGVPWSFDAGSTRHKPALAGRHSTLFSKPE